MFSHELRKLSNAICWANCSSSQKRFGEHYRRMNKPNKIDNFLYRHFKRKGHTPANILVHPGENITYDANSTSRLKIINRHESKLKWI